MSDIKLAIGNEHNPYCGEDETADFHTIILSYHNKEIEVGIYVYCSDCGRLLGKTTATVALQGFGAMAMGKKEEEGEE